MAAAASLVAGEFVMTAEDFRRITTALHAASGIVMNETKATLVYSRLAKRVRQLGLDSFRSYCKLLAGPDGEAERPQMLSALTTNLTRFFREPHHFDHLRTEVLPPLLARARRGGRVRLWSAACSNGAEAYSAAMTVLDLMPDAVEHDIRVLATDIDQHMVATARTGVYEGPGTQGLPGAAGGRWMDRERGDGTTTWSAGEALRRLVSFRQLNLLGPWPMAGRFDAIFCRNVCIYFDEPTQNTLWGRFADALSPGGMLYIGHSERVNGDAQARLRSVALTTYELTGGGP